MDGLLLILIVLPILVALGCFLTPAVAGLVRNTVQRAVGICRERVGRRSGGSRGRALHCVPQSAAASWWQPVRFDGQPAMLLVSDWEATNLSGRPLHLETAVLHRPREAQNRVRAASVAVRHPDTQLFGDHALPPERPVAVAAKIWVQPADADERDAVRAAIAFVDSSGFEHRLDEVSFLPHTDPAIARALSAHRVESAVGGAPAQKIRRYPRVGVNLETELWANRQGYQIRGEGRSTVLGAGGAFVEVRERYAVTSLLRIRFRCRELANLFCRAIVRSISPLRGVGVEFLDLSPSDRERLAVFVRASGQGGHGYPGLPVL